GGPVKVGPRTGSARHERRRGARRRSRQPGRSPARLLLPSALSLHGPGVSDGAPRPARDRGRPSRALPSSRRAHADRRADRRRRPKRAPLTAALASLWLLRPLRALAAIRPRAALCRRRRSRTIRRSVRGPLAVIRPFAAIHLGLGSRGGRLPGRAGRVRRCRMVLRLASCATVVALRPLAALGSRIRSRGGWLALRCRRLRLRWSL